MASTQLGLVLSAWENRLQTSPSPRKIAHVAESVYTLLLFNIAMV